jgi:hypothetical protein
MDGDGHADLLGQANIQSLLDVLADELHADHAETLAVFEHNEALALAGLQPRFGASQPLVPRLAELWAVFMSIQGEGSYQGPTHTGMAGRVEALWNMFTLANYVGPFSEQAWQQSALFVPGEVVQATLVVTNNGVVDEGGIATFSVTPLDGLAYRWYKDDEQIDGANGSTFVLDPVTLSDSGDYYCEIDVTTKATITTPVVTLEVNETTSVPLGSMAPYLLLMALAIHSWWIDKGSQLRPSSSAR